MLDRNNKNACETLKKRRVRTPGFGKNKIAWLSLFLSLAALILSLSQYFPANRQNADREPEAQARSISAFIKEDTENYSTAALYNLSNSPVYDVVITVVSVGSGCDYAQDGKSVRKSEGADSGVLLTILPPGKYKVKMPPIGHGMSNVFGVEIAFRDNGNNSWIISADGRLTKISLPPLKYYNLPGPNDFGKLEDCG